jgi:DNA-binding IclR family transcriptional regulator
MSRAPAKGNATELAAHQWTFLTNHAHVLICIAGDRDARIRDIARSVGITERAVARILAELEADGYVEREREGRRNHYKIRSGQPLRHPLEEHRTVGALLKAIVREENKSR